MLNNHLIAHGMDARMRESGQPVHGEPPRCDWKPTSLHPARETWDSWRALLRDLWRKWRGR